MIQRVPEIMDGAKAGAEERAVDELRVERQVVGVERALEE